MNNGIRKLFGLMFNLQKEAGRELFAEMKIEWTSSVEEEEIFNHISSLVLKGEEVTLLTFMLEVNSTTENRSVILLASECSSLITSGDFLQVDAILQFTKQEYLTRTANLLKFEVEQLLKNSSLNVDKYSKILTNGLNVINSQMTKKIATIESEIEEVLKRHDLAKNGKIKSIGLGYRTMKTNIQLEEVDLCVIGARPAMGKTSFIVETLIRLAFHENKKVAFFNLEMSNTQMIRRVLSNLTGISSKKMKLGELTDREISLVSEMKKRPEFRNIVMFEGSHTIQQISMKLNELKHNNSVEVFIVDYLQKITPEKGTNRFTEVTQASNGLKFISQNMKIPCIALAQLGRGNTTRSGDHRPVLSDLRDSGEIEQDASVVMFLHRPEYYGIVFDEDGNSTEGKAEVIISKNRDGEVGIINFNVDLATSKWDDTPLPSSGHYNPDAFIESSTTHNNLEF